MFTLADPAGTPVDGDTVTVTVTLPDASTDVQTVTSTTTGTYQHDYLTTQAGRHTVQWLATGTHPGAQLDAFDVADQTPAIVSLADAKAQLNGVSSTDEDTLRGYIAAATNVVERVRGETVVVRSFTEQLSAVRGHIVISHLPLVSITSIASLDGTVIWDVTQTVHDDAGVIASTGTPFAGDLLVTYSAGRTVIPPHYQLAAQIIIEHLWQTRRGTMGVARPGGMDVSPVAGLGFAVPNRALELLGGGLSGVA